jgi:hypothetical protein
MASAQQADIGGTNAGTRLKVVITKQDGIRSFAFSYMSAPLPAGNRSFLRQPGRQALVVTAIGTTGNSLDWQVVDQAGNIVDDFYGSPAKQSTVMPSGPAYDGIYL